MKGHPPSLARRAAASGLILAAALLSLWWMHNPPGRLAHPAAPAAVPRASAVHATDDPVVAPVAAWHAQAPFATVTGAGALRAVPDLFRRAHPDAQVIERRESGADATPVRHVRTLWRTGAGASFITEETFLQPADGAAPVRLAQSACRADSLVLTVAGGAASEHPGLAGRLRAAGFPPVAVRAFSPTFAVTVRMYSLDDYDACMARVAALAGGDCAVARNDLFFPATATPNDPRYAEQWALGRIGAPQAWAYTAGAAGTIVAVVDSGIDFSHPDFHHDLGANFWTHPGEVAGNGSDDDGNGFIDDVRGWNFAEDNADASDPYGHGTRMAGIIGAAGNNGYGITGVSQRVALMPLRVGSASFTLAAVIQAVDYATSLRAAGHPLVLLNNSYVRNEPGKDPTEPDALYRAIERAGEAGILFVAAAGNSGADNDAADFLGKPNHYFPSDYALANILSVTASGKDDKRLSNANYGKQSVDLAAPGTDILTTVRGGDFAAGFGTSFACAVASGAAALLHAWNPDLEAAALKELLMDNGDLVATLTQETVSGRRLNIGNALLAATAWPRLAWSAMSAACAQAGWPFTLVLACAVGADPVDEVFMQWGDSEFAATPAGDGAWAADIVVPAPANSVWRARVRDAAGRELRSAALRVPVLDATAYWICQYFGSQEEGFQPAAFLSGEVAVDGTPLLLSMFHGWSPHLPAAGQGGAIGALPQAGFLGWPPGDRAPFLEFSRNLRAEGLRWRVEASTDLRVWGEATGLSVETLASDPEQALERLRVHLPAAAAPRFYRFHIDLPDGN
jgi:subtilisin family serine protease